jgi:hypothetical protein
VGKWGQGKTKVAPFFKLRHVFGKFWHGALSLSLLKESSYRYVEENSFKKTNGGCSGAAARVSNPNELVAAFSFQEAVATQRSMRQKKATGESFAV